MRNVIMGMLFYALCAPPLGGIIVGLALIISDPVGEVGLVDVIQVMLTFGLFSYIFGIIPALLTGALADAMLCRFTPLAASLALGLLGALLSIALQYNNSSNLSNGDFWLMFGAPAFFSGILISLLFNRSFRVQSNDKNLDVVNYDIAKHNLE